MLPSLAAGQWKLDSELSAASDVTLHANITVMCLHDSISNRQSKACTRAHSFRCKKRIKDRITSDLFSDYVRPNVLELSCGNFVNRRSTWDPIKPS